MNIKCLSCKSKDDYIRNIKQDMEKLITIFEKSGIEPEVIEFIKSKYYDINHNLKSKNKIYIYEKPCESIRKIN